MHSSPHLRQSWESPICATDGLLEGPKDLIGATSKKIETRCMGCCFFSRCLFEGGSSLHQIPLCFKAQTAQAPGHIDTGAPHLFCHHFRRAPQAPRAARDDEGAPTARVPQRGAGLAWRRRRGVVGVLRVPIAISLSKARTKGCHIRILYISAIPNSKRKVTRVKRKILKTSVPNRVVELDS